MDVKQINLERRAKLFNIKAANSGSLDYFGKDPKKEKQLEIEREKLAMVLYQDGVELKLVRPGEVKNEKNIFDRGRSKPARRI